MRLIVLIMLFLMPPVLAVASETGIVAIVNDEPISLYDLNNRIDLAIASSQLDNTPEIRKNLVPQVLQLLINESLQLQEAKRLNIEISQDNIQQAVHNVERQNNVGEGQLRQALEKDGLDYSSLLRQIRATIAWQALVQRKAGPLLEISDQEVDAALEDLKNPASRRQYRYAEIFLPLSAETPDEEVRRNAQDIFGKIKGGADFARLARSFSASPSALSGGDAGWQSERELTPEVREVLSQVEKGFLSEPFRAGEGYMIVLLLDRRLLGGDQVELPSREQMIVSLRRRKLDQVSRKYGTDLRREATIEIRIAPARG